MLGVGGLLSASYRAVRRQGWLVVPFTLTHAVTQLLALVPWAVLAARAIAAGRSRGAHGVGAALVAGAPELLERPGSWVLLLAGLALMSFGAWLLRVLIRTGALKLLAEQVGHSEVADDAAFASGAIESSANALLTAALAAFLMAIASCSALGMIVAGMSYFSAHPGATAALLMTVATLMIVLLPAIVAALEVGFARAVILCEGPLTALAGGLALARRRSGIVVVWYAFAFAQLAAAIAFGSMDATLAAIGQGDVAVLFAGPRLLVIVAGMSAASALELLLLGAFAAAIRDDEGMLPESAQPSEPVYTAVAIAEVLPAPPPVQ